MSILGLSFITEWWNIIDTQRETFTFWSKFNEETIHRVSSESTEFCDTGYGRNIFMSVTAIFFSSFVWYFKVMILRRYGKNLEFCSSKLIKNCILWIWNNEANSNASDQMLSSYRRQFPIRWWKSESSPDIFTNSWNSILFTNCWPESLFPWNKIFLYAEMWRISNRNKRTYIHYSCQYCEIRGSVLWFSLSGKKWWPHLLFFSWHCTLKWHVNRETDSWYIKTKAFQMSLIIMKIIFITQNTLWEISGLEHITVPVYLKNWTALTGIHFINKYMIKFGVVCVS